jgi:hypothetical protein
MHHELADIRQGLLRLQWLAAAARWQRAMYVNHLALKAGFNPNQPRDELGRWSGGSGTGFVAKKPLSRIGHNKGPRLEPPTIPKQRPPTAKLRNAIVRDAARFLVRATRIGSPVGAFLTLLNVIPWTPDYLPYIDAYQDAPKSLEELQDAVSVPKTAYDIHHIVEQTPARYSGFLETLQSYECTSSTESS